LNRFEIEPEIGRGGDGKGLTKTGIDRKFRFVWGGGTEIPLLQNPEIQRDIAVFRRSESNGSDVLQFKTHQGEKMNTMQYTRKPAGAGKPRSAGAMYRDFDASQLYCPRCRRAVPVRKRLLLVLPEGDKYEYLCAFCSESVGTKIDRQQQPLSLIL